LISFDGDEIFIKNKKDLNNLSHDKREKLQKYVKALVEKQS
jgi:hypothetical protein